MEKRARKSWPVSKVTDGNSFEGNPMRIIKLLDRDSQDIEVPLLQMTNSGDRLEAFRGRKLLELVRHLQAQGPAPPRLATSDSASYGLHRIM